MRFQHLILTLTLIHSLYTTINTITVIRVIIIISPIVYTTSITAVSKLNNLLYNERFEEWFFWGGGGGMDELYDDNDIVEYAYQLII